MYKIPIQEVKEKIVLSGKLSANELEEKIKSKINELSGLISEEGAAHIIANELGVSVAPKEGEKITVKKMYSGMRNIECVVKVVQKYESREFSKGESTGKVCSLLVGDESGVIRFVLWNEQVDLLTAVEAGTILHIKDAYARDNNGRCEIHLGRSGVFDIDPEGMSVEVAERSSSFVRKSIQELGANEENIELLGTIVQVFDPRFFEVHPETGKRIQPGEDVTPALSYVMNVVIDDGTGNIRCVLWKNQTNKLLKTTDTAFCEYKENPQGFEETKTDLLGEQVSFVGRVKNNEMFNRLEFNVQFVQKADPAKEIKRLEEVSTVEVIE
jgi:hypothetical protein